MAQPQEFPFNIMDVAELLHLHIRRRQADSVYADCPICGDKRGKMNINFAKNLWRCNYCNEGGGMLSLYGKVYGINNSEAYREICDTLQNGLTAPEYTAKELPEQAAIEQSVLASPQEIHQTFSMLLELLTLIAAPFLKKIWRSYDSAAGYAVPKIRRPAALSENSARNTASIDIPGTTPFLHSLPTL